MHDFIFGFVSLFNLRYKLLERERENVMDPTKSGEGLVSDGLPTLSITMLEGKGESISLRQRTLFQLYGSVSKASVPFCLWQISWSPFGVAGSWALKDTSDWTKTDDRR